MICVERLNGEILYLNWLQVELIEQIPETKIRMMNGDYYLVKDSVESIKDQVTGFFQRCVSNIVQLSIRDIKRYSKALCSTHKRKPL